MEIKKLEANLQDERGLIKDILFNEPINHVTVITSVKGVVRGNHLHKKTIQWIYLYSGKLKSLTQNEGEEVISRILEPGDLLKTGKCEKHALHALEDSVFFVFTRGPRGGKNYESDTFRLEKPLEENRAL